MATLTVNQTKSYQRTALSDIGQIDFTNGFLAPATATFSAAQFDGVRIATGVAIDGNKGANGIVVRGSIDASSWTFTFWSSFNDSVTLEGTCAANTLTGSKVHDTTTGDGAVDFQVQLAGSINLAGADFSL